MKEAKESIRAMVAETLPLVFSLVMSLATDRVVRTIGEAADPDWKRASHILLVVADTIAWGALVLPKALVLLNEIAGLVMNVLETFARGIRRVVLALQGKESEA